MSGVKKTQRGLGPHMCSRGLCCPQITGEGRFWNDHRPPLSQKQLPDDLQIRKQHGTSKTAADCSSSAVLHKVNFHISTSRHASSKMVDSSGRHPMANISAKFKNKNICMKRPPLCVVLYGTFSKLFSRLTEMPWSEPLVTTICPTGKASLSARTFVMPRAFGSG